MSKGLYTLSFLEKNKKFTWQGSIKLRSFSCFKDKSGYWKAQKKVDGKVRQKRLGNSQKVSEMTNEDFSQIATFLTEDYTSKNLENESLQMALKASISTNQKLEHENNKLREQVEALEEKLLKYDVLPNVNSLTELIKKVENKESGYKANSASKLINELKTIFKVD